jgi:hypothetical protein
VAAKHSAWMCVRESLHDFRLHEWAPFAWILLLQLVFLTAMLNLGSAWGMAIGSGAASLVGRSDEVIHYPRVFVMLPSLSSLVEWVLYVGLGSALIPLALLRISEPMEGGAAESWGRRVRRAILPTLVAGVANILLLEAWDWVLSKGVAPILQPRLPGVSALIVPWFLGAIVAYAIAAPLLFVPIRAIERGAGFLSALIGGIGEGVRMIWPAFLIVFVCSWPALLFLAAAQMDPGVIVRKMRPELVAYFLIAYAVITSFASYIIYAAASRLHWAQQAA